MQCPRCLQWFADPDETDAIRDWGYCTGCDHIEGNVDIDELSSEIPTDEELSLVGEAEGYELED